MSGRTPTNIRKAVQKLDKMTDAEIKALIEASKKVKHERNSNNHR